VWDFDSLSRGWYPICWQRKFFSKFLIFLSYYYILFWNFSWNCLKNFLTIYTTRVGKEIIPHTSECSEILRIFHILKLKFSDFLGNFLEFWEYFRVFELKSLEFIRLFRSFYEIARVFFYEYAWLWTFFRNLS
jgi:hypothetical protein